MKKILSLSIVSLLAMSLLCVPLSAFADTTQADATYVTEQRVTIQNETVVLKKIKRALELKTSFLKKLLGEGSASNAIRQEIISVLIEKEMTELAELEANLDTMDSATVRRYLEHINHTYVESGENALLAWDYVRANDPITENQQRAELIRGLMLLSKGPSSFSYDTPLTSEWPKPPESKTIESEYMGLIEDIIASIDTHG